MSDLWHNLNGNPTPGSPESLGMAIGSFQKVVDNANLAQRRLATVTASTPIGTWKGTAAESFRKTVHELPRQLTLVSTSFSDAAVGLRVFKGRLEQLQAQAAGLRTRADTAASDAARETALRDAAAVRLDGLRRRRPGLVSARDALQKQLSAATDPTQRATLTSQLATAKARVTTLDADIRAADSDRNRHERAASEAHQRRADAVRDAAGLLRQLNEAAERACATLKQAEREAQLPNWLERKSTEVKEWIVEYGPALVEALDLAAQLFTIAAAILPFGAPIFLTLAIACSAVSMLTTLLSAQLSPEGITAETMWHLARQALTIAGAACGLGAFQGVKWAAKAIDLGKDVTEVGESYAADGMGGALVTVGGVVVGYGAQKLIGAGVNSALDKMHANPSMQAKLDGISERIRAYGEDVNPRISAPARFDPNDVRGIQSVLAGNNVRPGGFMFGNHAPVNPTLFDHRLGREAEQDFITTTIAEPLADLLGIKLDEGVDWVIDNFRAREDPEIDINLSADGT